MLFKLSNLKSNLALTLGYLNPALNISALYIVVLWLETVTKNLNLVMRNQLQLEVV